LQDLEDKKGTSRIDDANQSIRDFFCPGEAACKEDVMKEWIVCFCACMILWTTPGLCFEAEKQAESPVLETVVVTGARTEQKIETVAANVTVIDQKAIESSNAKSVVDLLRVEEGIVVKDLLGNGRQAQVDLRGYGETGPYNTLVLVDGRRVNEIDLSGVDWTQVPLNQIERIEIVRGAGSVLYGDNAVGGVINIITKAPGAEPQARVELSGGSYGKNTQSAYVSGGSEKFGAAVFADRDASDGYRDNGDFTALDVGFKMFLYPSESLTMRLDGSRHVDEYGLPGALTEAEMAVDRRATNSPQDNADNDEHYLRYSVDWETDAGNFITDIAWRERSSISRWASWSWFTDSDIETWSITPRYVNTGDVFGHENTLTAGVDAYWTQMDLGSYYSSDMNDPSEISDIERDSLGLYVQDDLSVFENLIFGLGARFEKVRYDLNKKDLTGWYSPLDAEVDDEEYACSAGLTYLYGENSSAFARYNRSLRYPLVDELVVYDFMSGSIVVNENLKPQTGNHYDFGIRHNFTSKLQARATVFFSRIEDEIFYNKATYSNENHPKTSHHGVETGIRADLSDHFTIFGNYTYENAVFEADPYKDNDIPGVAAHKANIGILVRDLTPGLILSALYNYVGTSYAISDMANVLDKQKAYYTVDLKASYKWRNIRGFVGVNNITDQQYSEYVVASSAGCRAFYPAPERNWTAGIQVEF